ncbi:MAG: citramalate synthase, partial [Deltaproteobacteria bacterium]|nr:citramalate synthase [Deltaproteobacteria bacterium]
LCDTNGGTMPYELTEIIRDVRKTLGDGVQLGIHCHNDAEVAVANSLSAVRAGVTQIQGTMNGFGERCGNANLCSVIPGLMLKMGYECTAGNNLDKLTSASRFVSEIANLSHNKYQPYVGESAFAHKGGIHVSAVQRNPESYEHIRPELVGNIQRILISDLSGKSNILAKARQYGLDLESHDPVVLDIVAQLKELEAQGFQFEGAEASFELLMRKAMGTRRKYFDLLAFRVIDQKFKDNEPTQAEATIKVRVGGHTEHTAAVGNGPVNALDNAIRKALEKFYPQLKEMTLQDYKVRVLPGSPGTEAKVRVLIESRDQHDKWGTVGLSNDIIDASWQALVDAICFKLLKSEKEKPQV